MKKWYARYLAGTDLNKAAKTLLGYAALLFMALTGYMHATPERAAIGTCIATIMAIPVYLMIPKSAQALVDNVAQELLSRQTDAGSLAAKLNSVIPVGADSQTTTIADVHAVSITTQGDRDPNANTPTAAMTIGPTTIQKEQ